MTWKYDDDKCQCGLEETEKHVLFECTLYGEERGRWRVAVRDLNDGIEEYEIIKGYRVRSKKNRKRTHEISESNVGGGGNSRQRHERWRDCGLERYITVCMEMRKRMEWLQTTQPTSGGAVTVVSSCCANCVEPPRPQQWVPDLPFFGHAGHADPLDGWRCCSQKRVMSRPILFFLYSVHK